MDLSQFDTSNKASAGAFLHLRDPNGEPLFDEDTGEAVGVTLIGADAPEYRKAVQDQMDERLERSQRSGRLNVGSAKQLENEQINLLALATKDFHHIQLHGERLEYSELNARRLYQLHFVREQAQQFINNRKNFLGN